MKGINVFTAYELKHWQNETEILGKYTPARPIGKTGIIYRVKKAWQVFTGKADLVVWRHQ